MAAPTMILHLDPAARTVAQRAFDHAIRLGHGYLGGEHILLALAAADTPAGVVLREHGLAPARVEAQLVQLAGAGLFGDLDRAALAATGIDLDAMRARAGATFGPHALSQANRAVRRGPAISRWTRAGYGSPGRYGTACSSRTAAAQSRPCTTPAARQPPGTPSK
jgi:Clp amino terminal domain, pathogenicity island component